MAVSWAYVLVLASRPSYRVALELPKPGKLGATRECRVGGVATDVELRMDIDRRTASSLVALTGLVRSWKSRDLPS